jgi:hypothetical protein
MIGGGENVGSGLTEGGWRVSGVGAGAAETGVAKLADLEMAGDSERTGGLDGTVVEADTAPFSRLTSFKVGSLPEKNSPAVKEGSGDGAGG